MASHLVRALQPHYRKALEELPPKIASAAKSVIGEELTLLSLLATVFLGWLAYSLLKRSFSRRKNLPPSECSLENCFMPAEVCVQVRH